jgi:hypothetical protein
MRFPHYRFVPAIVLVAVFLAGCGGGASPVPTAGADGPTSGDSRPAAGSGVAPARWAVVPGAVAGPAVGGRDVS